MQSLNKNEILYMKKFRNFTLQRDHKNKNFSFFFNFKTVKRKKSYFTSKLIT